MKKKILLGLTFFALVTGVSAQSLQNFEYSPSEDEYPIDLTGGESFTQNINFTSEADQELPFGVRVTVENDSTNFETDESLGAEFGLKGTLEDSRTERSLVFEERLTDGNLVYVGSIDAENESLGPQSENSLEIEIEANTAISPDNFNFEFDVRSAPGFASETNSSDVGSDKKAQVRVGGSSVSVNTETGKNVTVEKYDETTVSSPAQDREFVGGVGVEVKDDNNEDAEANGTVSIGYSQEVVDERDLNENSMAVYYYNDSSMEWTTEGVVVVNRDTENNVVEANVSHFSTYAAFAEQQEEDTDSGSTGGDVIPYDPQPENQDEPVNDTQQENETSETQDQQDANTEPEGDTDDQETSREDDSEGADESEQVTGQQENTPQTPAGQFFTSETGIAGGLVVLLVAIVVFLEYTGRIELRELKEVLKQKLSR